MPRSKFPPPADFDDESKALWKRTIKDLEEQETWEPSDAPTLERYVRATERARLGRAGMVHNGEVKLLAVGSTGQPVPHPNIKTVREAERDAHEYAKDLLLTPKAREQHEIAKKAAERGSKFGLD
jgi:P27 family predicted phage terminase small subunit